MTTQRNGKDAMSTSDGSMDESDVPAAQPFLPSTPSTLRPSFSLRALHLLPSPSRLVFFSHLQPLAVEVQPAQPPTSTSYARPQQPTDSPAAALPTETLIRILELALEDEQDPLERQQMRWRSQKVSWQWLSAAGEQREYAVAIEQHAAALVQALGQTDRALEVQSLALAASNNSGCVGPSSEDLLKLCSATRKLELRLIPPRFLGLQGGGSVTKGALESLVGSKGVRRFVLSDAWPHTQYNSFDLTELLNFWTSLQTLEINPGFLQSHTTSSAAPSLLQHLDIPADSILIRSLLAHSQDSTLPRSLTIRSSRDGFLGREAAEALLPFAARLQRFSAPDGWQPSTEFEQLISAMTNIQLFELGYTVNSTTSNSDATSHNLPAAASLGQLASLRELTLRDAGEGGAGTTLPPTLNDRLSSPPPPSLKRIQCDLSLTTSWAEGARADLESKAEAAGVWLVFVV